MTIPAVDETYLVALIQDPTITFRAWAGQAACTDLPLSPDAYFPDDDKRPCAEALACCFACPVAHHCLATALVYEGNGNDRFGWWGGYGPDEREDLRSRIEVAAPPPPSLDVVVTDPGDIARYLLEQRHTVPSIAAALGCSERTIYRYLRRDRGMTQRTQDGKVA